MSQLERKSSALRSQFLPTTYKAEVTDLFNRYIKIRLESVLRTSQFSIARQQLDNETLQLQTRLWNIARDAAEADSDSIPLGLFTHAVNQLIDFKTQRDIAVANHVPESVLLLLFIFAFIAMGVLGYVNGLEGSRSPALTFVYYIIIVMVILLIIDLDRPQQGLARVSQASMIQLQEIIKSGQR